MGGGNIRMCATEALAGVPVRIMIGSRLLASIVTTSFIVTPKFMVAVGGFEPTTVWILSPLTLPVGLHGHRLPINVNYIITRW